MSSSNSAIRQSECIAAEAVKAAKAVEVAAVEHHDNMMVAAQDAASAAELAAVATEDAETAAADAADAVTSAAVDVSNAADAEAEAEAAAAYAAAEAALNDAIAVKAAAKAIAKATLEAAAEVAAEIAAEIAAEDAEAEAATEAKAQHAQANDIHVPGRVSHECKFCAVTDNNADVNAANDIDNAEVVSVPELLRRVNASEVLIAKLMNTIDNVSDTHTEREYGLEARIHELEEHIRKLEARNRDAKHAAEQAGSATEQAERTADRIADRNARRAAYRQSLAGKSLNRSEW